MTAPLIRFVNVTKRFQAVTALDSVSFEVRPGEFHALCGENGAGKSTLMKILSGVITDYDGQIQLEGRPLELNGPRDAQAAGIAIIHQELNLVGDLTAAANIFLGREKRRGGFWLDEREMHDEARGLFQSLECQVRSGDAVRRYR